MMPKSIIRPYGRSQGGFAMSIGFRSSIGAAVLLVFTLPAAAQQLNLPPDVLGALTELYQNSTYLCQNGLQVSCATAVAIDRQAGMMSDAMTQCQQGNQQACGWYQSAVQQVAVAYQQVYAPPPTGQPFDTNAMTLQHQQNMQTLQNQFDAGQQRYQQQMQTNDQMFENYMGTLGN
jgi:hypothetical protein